MKKKRREGRERGEGRGRGGKGEMRGAREGRKGKQGTPASSAVLVWALPGSPSPPLL